MSKKDLRQQEILRIIDKKGLVEVRELVNTLNVTDMTIRRDIAECENQLLLINGIVIKKDTNEKMYHVNHQRYLFEEEKRKIGHYAASLVNNDESIGIDLGTTTEYMASFLPESSDNLVVCNALNIFNELEKKNLREVILCGGRYHPHTQTFDSSRTLEAIRDYRFSKVFMSAAGFSLQMGATCVNDYETSYKKLLMANAVEKILLIDSSKYQVTRTVSYADAFDFTKIITDAIFTKEDQKLLQNRGIEYVEV